MWGEGKLICIPAAAVFLTPSKTNDLFWNLECLCSILHKLYNLVNIVLTLNRIVGPVIG